jgi:hypothetical protein
MHVKIPTIVMAPDQPTSDADRVADDIGRYDRARHDRHDPTVSRDII